MILHIQHRSSPIHNCQIIINKPRLQIQINRIFRSTPYGFEVNIPIIFYRIIEIKMITDKTIRSISRPSQFTKMIPRISKKCTAQRERSEEHTSELQSRGHLVCRLLLEKKNEQNRPANT